MGGKTLSDERFAKMVKMADAEGSDGIPLAAFKKIMRGLA